MTRYPSHPRGRIDWECAIAWLSVLAVIGGCAFFAAYLGARCGL